ncbi:MAG TPA: LapA family protein [Alphaproteobacteria bacterium]|nr:LapA family protein [Alphaproteobacteria bacterium]HNS44704.1 LapA family protein [Alphaproteobacteria bacterium]
MSGFFKIVLTFLFAAILFWIILVNRGPVAFSLDPLWNADHLPMATIIFAAVVFGFLWGALVVWLNGAKVRSQCRQQKKEIQKLEEQTGVSL